MATMEERMKILQMVQEGKITPEDAAQLLEAINTGSAEAAPAPRRPGSPASPFPPEGPLGPGRKPRFLRVRVTDTDSGRPRVNVRLPISMVSVGLKMGSKFAPQIEGLDADQLMQIIESGDLGQIVDVVDDEDGEHVEVFLE
jgi:SHOCT-like domain